MEHITDKEEKVVNILDDNIGEVTLVDWMGGDLANVNAARSSYGAESSVLAEGDKRLLHRLGVDGHTTPFRHTYFQFHVTAPEFVARQWYKHIVGCEYAFKDLPWNEFSQRFKEVAPQFYIPSTIRIQDQINKQASTLCHDSGLAERTRSQFEDATAIAYCEYLALLDAGIAREQARIILPLSVYTSWVWTASLQAVVHFCQLRSEPGAQYEIQCYAQALMRLCRGKAPESWDALTKG